MEIKKRITPSVNTLEYNLFSKHSSVPGLMRNQVGRTAQDSFSSERRKSPREGDSPIGAAIRPPRHTN